MDYLIAGLLVAAIALLLVLLLRKKDGSGDAFARLEEALRAESIQSRKEYNDALALTRTELDKKLSLTSEAQNSRISDMTRTNNENLQRMGRTVEERLDRVRQSVEQKLSDIQKDNAEKLETMRQTVDEKLHKTLEERLGESFKTVSDRLEQVHKGLGEMQNLAQGVGDLKKVLTNVTTRGSFGEIQLGNILEQLLTPDQYETNISTKPRSTQRVEFALKLPGKEGEPVYMPIDSKFPTESYDRMQDAYTAGDAEGLAAAGREMEQFIKKSAKDIRDKYLSPPHTTDFGVLFLPTEGLYAEVLRRPGLVEGLQRDYHIIVSGPTTLSALLNSLQMGFRTLAIEKRSSEVWKILAAVKTEFGKFGDALAKTQNHIRLADKDIDELIGVRTRQIISRLKTVEALPGELAEEALAEEAE